MLDYDGDGDVQFEELETAVSEAYTSHLRLRVKNNVEVQDVLQRVAGRLAKEQVGGQGEGRGWGLCKCDLICSHVLQEYVCCKFAPSNCPII